MNNIAPPSPPYLGPAKFQGGKSNKPIKRIVMHGTVSPCVKGGARATARYFRELVTRPSSAHYVADPGESVQVVFDSWVAFHAPPNPGSIGYELCDWVAANNGKGPGPAPMERWNDEPHTAMLKIAAKDVARLCLAYNIPIRFIGPIGLRLGRKGICEHSDVSTAWHQTSHWDLGNFPRTRFLRMVKAEAKALQGIPRARVNMVMSASRFDRSAGSLLTALRTYLPGNDLVFLTEVANDKRSWVFKTVGLLPGVGYVNIEPGSRSECAILYKKWKWKLRASRAFKVTDIQSTKLGTILPYDLGAAFEHFRTGQVLGILLGHKPAHLEGQDGFRTDPQGKFNTKAWKESVTADAAITERWLANELIDHVMVWNDWNLSWRKGWVREEVRSYFAGQELTNNWAGSMPATGGTLPGDRITEYGMGDVDWVDSRLLKDDPSSDHRPCRARALLRRVPAKVSRAGTVRL